LPPEFINTLDKLVKTDLLNWRDTWFHCLLWSTAVVGLGLALEGPELWLEIKHITLDRRDRRNFFALSHHEIPPKLKVLAFIGWLLIVIGVVGEGAFEAMVSRADGQVQTFNDILLEDAQRQAGNARIRTAELEKEAAQLRLQIADRHITFQQRQEMLAMLRPQAGTGVLVEYVTPSGTDAPEYAIEIGGVFHDAGWKVTPSLGRLITMNPPLHGFAVEGGAKESRAAKKALGLLDKRVHIAPPTPSPETGQIRKTGMVIYVGSK
jgi:hypothetical protein